MIKDLKFKAEWIAALRSGEFEQMRGSLRFTESTGENFYCCLGVACVLRGEPFLDNKETSWTLKPGLNERNLGMVIPGLTEAEADTLATMNDSGTTFPEIADYIERNL